MFALSSASVAKMPLLDRRRHLAANAASGLHPDIGGFEPGYRGAKRHPDRRRAGFLGLRDGLQQLIHLESPCDVFVSTGPWDEPIVWLGNTGHSWSAARRCVAGSDCPAIVWVAGAIGAGCATSQESWRRLPDDLPRSGKARLDLPVRMRMAPRLEEEPGDGDDGKHGAASDGEWIPGVGRADPRGLGDQLRDFFVHHFVSEFLFGRCHVGHAFIVHSR